MLALLEIVGGNGIPHPLRPVLLLGFHAVDGVGHGSLSDGVLEDALLFLCVVETKGGFDVEALEGVDVQVGIAEHAPVGVTVIAVAVQTGHGVLAVGIAAHGTCVVSAGGVDGE